MAGAIGGLGAAVSLLALVNSKAILVDGDGNAFSSV